MPNPYGYTFHDGIVLPPQGLPSHDAHTFNPTTDEPGHAYDHTVTHAPYARVMETLVEPDSCHYAYAVNQYVYVHGSAYNTNPLSALECRIVNVDNAPLEIMVQPCNHPEQTFAARQDQLSAPIWV